MTKRLGTTRTRSAAAGQAPRAAPKSREQMREALTEAAKRLLAGKPTRTDGALDVATLCREATVVRTSAYRACSDIIADFEQDVRDFVDGEASAHPMVRMQKRAEAAEKKVAMLTDDLKQANARIGVLANQLNMAMRRVVKAEELRAADRESIEAERVRTSKEITELRAALGARGRNVTSTGAILSLHRDEDA